MDKEEANKSCGSKTFRFYHFLKAEYVESFLRHGLLKVTQLGYSNDYFEFKPAFYSPNNEQLWKASLKGNEPCVVCLSAKMSSSVMWGHYGEQGRGVCLAFELPLSNQKKDDGLYPLPDDVFASLIVDNKLPLLKVIYASNRFDITRIPLTTEEEIDRAGFSLLSYKAKDWEYEQEYRMAVPERLLKPKDGHLFYTGMLPFCTAILRGWNCPITSLYFRSLLNECNLSHISVADTFPSMDTYDICVCGSENRSFGDTNVDELDDWLWSRTKN